MAETRMLPKHTPRSTGIERTTGQVRPNSAQGNNATSHVSAAPGVSRATHQHVVNARDPAAAAAGGRRTQIIGGSRGGQDAKVELLPDLRGQRGGQRGAIPAQVGQVASVQIVDRPRAAGGDAAPFTVDGMMLMASLLEQYAERTGAVGDIESTKIAEDCLMALREMLSPRAPRPAPAPAPAPTATAPTPKIETRDDRSTRISAGVRRPDGSVSFSIYDNIHEDNDQDDEPAIDVSRGPDRGPGAA